MKRVNLLVLCLVLGFTFCFAGCDDVKKIEEGKSINIQAGTTYTMESISGEIVSADESIAYYSDGLIYGVSAGSTEITQKNGSNVVKYAVSVTAGEDKDISDLTDMRVSSFGRNEVIDGKLNLYHSASSFEVGFVGTSISIDVSVALSGCSECYISVLTDNDEDYSKRVEAISSEQTIAVTFKTNKYHRVKILKRNEAKHNTLTVESCTTDGYFTFGKKKPSRKIEIYGDSISAGYTVLGNPFSMKTESALDTYSVIAADNLKAQVNIFAYTGIGLSFSTNYTKLMKGIYKQYTSEITKSWDFNSFVPDVVVINLGTNDFWAGAAYNAEDYKRDYIQLVKDLRAFYPDSQFVCMAGMMISDVNKTVEEVVATLNKTDEKVSYLELSGTVGGAHPSAVQHKSAGEKLTVHLKKLLNW